MTESTEGEANKMNIDGGKLVIVRYQKSKYIHNAATAYANAIQTPGVCVCVLELLPFLALNFKLFNTSSSV